MRQLTAIKVPFAGQTHLLHLPLFPSLISLSSRHLFLPRSPCPSSFVSCSRYSSHLYVRVAGLFPSSSHVRPTENPLRSPVALSLPSSLFPLPSSSVSLCPPSPLHPSLALLPPPFLPPPPLPSKISSFSNPVTLSEFLENTRVPEELFGISAAVAV